MEKIKISYAIPFKDEAQMPPFLVQLRQWDYKSARADYEVVALWDDSGDREVYKEVCFNSILEVPDNIIRVEKGKFEGNFADWKNLLNSLCTGDWIIQLDADEVITEKTFFAYEEAILALHEGPIECIMVPRYNTVVGLTEEDCKRWGWRWVGESGINYPDYQYRIYRKGMKWKNPVHEIIEARNYGQFPEGAKYNILHQKTVEKQRQQNDYYQKNFG